MICNWLEFLLNVWGPLVSHGVLNIQCCRLWQINVADLQLWIKSFESVNYCSVWNLLVTQHSLEFAVVWLGFCYVPKKAHQSTSWVLWIQLKNWKELWKQEGRSDFIIQRFVLFRELARNLCANISFQSILLLSWFAECIPNKVIQKF